MERLILNLLYLFLKVTINAHVLWGILLIQMLYVELAYIELCFYVFSLNVCVCRLDIVKCIVNPLHTNSVPVFLCL